MSNWQHRSSALRRELAAALPATGLQDGATGTGTHTQPETVGLCPPAVVRLEGPLAHGLAPSHRGCRPRDAKTAAKIWTTQAVAAQKERHTRTQRYGSDPAKVKPADCHRVQTGHRRLPQRDRFNDTPSDTQESGLSGSVALWLECARC